MKLKKQNPPMPKLFENFSILNYTIHLVSSIT
jgi:hypothetical protein